jgi:DNA helicase-2/ATP-dependent DNA helicase PcrA
VREKKMTEPAWHERILEDLNAEQLDAVTHGEGPLLIVAGAGTGKTKVITNRIAYLIASKRAEPSEILALTFTEKAAGEMEERVDLLVPYGYAESWIGTFHSFGEHVLRDHAMELGLTPEYRVLSQAEQIIFLREHLFKLPLRRYRPLGDPTKHLSEIASLINRAKDEAVSPSEYLDEAGKMLAEAQDGKSRGAAEAHREMAEVFQVYEELKAEVGCIDFGDQVCLPLRLFKERPEVLGEYQEKFPFILVDEFQDTNVAQFELLRLLAGETPNITVVGDDDQSIYRFRGAALGNILSFREHYPQARTVVLRQNYRSTAPILDASYRLIRHNDPHRLESSYGIDKRLIPRTDEGAPVILHRSRTSDEEADWVAGTIRKAVEEENASWGDAAVLVRARMEAKPIMRALNLHDIPYQVGTGESLYKQPEVRAAISFLRCVADPDHSVSLFELAGSEIYGFPALDLARLNAHASRVNRTLFQLFRELSPQQHPDAGQPATRGPEPLQIPANLDAETRALAARIAEHVEKHVALAMERTTGEVLHEFLSSSGYLERLTSDEDPQAEQRVLNLAKFFQLLQHHCQVLREDRVRHFVAYLDLLMEAGEDPKEAEWDPQADAVRLLTVHQAKGLEFPRVFMVCLVEQRFPRSGRRRALELPESLLKGAVGGKEGHTHEERRLFFVGMTRARDMLYVSAAEDYGGKRLRKLSRFVGEALDLPKLTVSAAPLSAHETIALYRPAPSTTTMSREDHAGPLALTPYQIEDYASCPLKYRFVHKLRVPVLTHHRVAYGNAIHRAIRAYLVSKKAGKPIGLDELLELFRSIWSSEGYLSREHEEERFEEGKRALKSFREGEQADQTVPLLVETEFTFPVGEDTVRGRWDRVDRRRTGAVIVDYKTSDVTDQERADKRARDSLQMAIYALGFCRTREELPSAVELRFVQSGLVGTARPTPESLEEVEAKIRDMATGVREGRFPANPSPVYCPYCAYERICPHSALRSAP